jgi:ArsR family transcriptional regulator
VPEIVVADLGSGEGLLSELLARKCKRVIAVDNSADIVKFGQAKAGRNGLANLEFRQGDLQHPPIDDASVDLAILSQALHHAEEPAQAIESAFRILKPGGQLMILDLVAHKFDKARELFGDRWLGFAESELHQWLESAGFGQIDISVVSREEDEPHFETLLASATRPA